MKEAVGGHCGIHNYGGVNTLDKQRSAPFNQLIATYCKKRKKKVCCVTRAAPRTQRGGKNTLTDTHMDHLAHAQEK